MRDWLERHQQILILGVAGAVFLGSFLVLRLLENDPQQIEFDLAMSDLPDGAPIRVHVTGAVVRPGVYELRAGDRVVDALAAAGGPAADAAVEDLNLARRVRDEEQIVVPGSSRAAAPSLPPGARLDINTATAAQLDLLPGIGEAYSRRIVDSRLVDGPFQAIEELVQRRVLPQGTFERVKDLIQVGP